MYKDIEDQKLKEEAAFKATGSRKLSLSLEEINELKQKKYICDGSIHPDTKEVIAWPMRMAAFVPANIPIIAGIMLSPQTPAINAFWQWFNQTYNAGMNYGNRNATSG